MRQLGAISVKRMGPKLTHGAETPAYFLKRLLKASRASFELRGA
jgi:hypothetical protein